MDRADHLQWAKGRAIAEIDRTSGFAGWIAFKHDMSKHPELAAHIAIPLGDEMVKLFATDMLSNPEVLRIFDAPGPANMRRFIEGFN